MVDVTLQGADTTQVSDVLGSIARTPVTTQTATEASYVSVVANRYASGTGFSYNSAGLLVSGTITGLTELSNRVNFESLSYSGLSLSVADAITLSTQGNAAAAALLSGSNTIEAGSNHVTGFAGNDVITPAAPLGPVTTVTTALAGGGGVNTVVAPVLISQATPSGGGGTETVVEPLAFGNTLTVNATSVQQLRFIDGNVYEGSSTTGGQVQLLFAGILGFTPGPIALGAYTAAAQANSLSAVAGGLLSSPSGQAATAGLNDTQYPDATLPEHPRPCAR